jgi:hypothetical protein
MLVSMGVNPLARTSNIAIVAGELHLLTLANSCADRAGLMLQAWVRRISVASHLV